MEEWPEQQSRCPPIALLHFSDLAIPPLAEAEEQGLLNRLDAYLFVCRLLLFVESYFVATIEGRPEQQSRCPPITPCHMFRAWLNLNLLELRRGPE
jgi:hypothetical protein